MNKDKQATIQTATDILREGTKILEQRGKEYNTTIGEQERSFASVAVIFKAKTGIELTPAHICLILQDLKDVRQFSQDRLHLDSIIDGVNYGALKGEELIKQYSISEIDDLISLFDTGKL